MKIKIKNFTYYIINGHCSTNKKRRIDRNGERMD